MIKIEQVYLGRVDMYEFHVNDKGDIDNYLFTLLAEKVNNLPCSDCIISVLPSLNPSNDHTYEYYPSAVVVVNTDLKYVVDSSRQNLKIFNAGQEK